MATRANTLIIFSAELYCWPLPASPLFAKMWWASVLCYILCFSVSSLSAQIFRGHNWMKNRFLDQTAEQSRFWSSKLFAKIFYIFIAILVRLCIKLVNVSSSEAMFTFVWITALYRHSSIYPVNVGAYKKTAESENCVNRGCLVVLKGRKMV